MAGQQLRSLTAVNDGFNPSLALDLTGHLKGKDAD